MSIVKSFSFTLIVTVMVCGLFFVSCVPFGVAQDGVITVISSDTTWTKAGSPYNFTGHVLVSEGATLTIESGVTVDFNYRNFRVDGTLRALGSSAEKIVFVDCMDFEFTETSVGWDEQTGSGSVIEYMNASSISIDSSVSLKVENSRLGSIHVGDSSIVSNNEIGSVNTGTSSVVSNNVVGNKISVGVASVVSGNTVGSVNAYSGYVYPLQETVISDNFIGGHVTAKDANISNNQIKNGVSGQSLIITDNNVTVSGSSAQTAISIEGGESVISGNTISGGGRVSDFSGRYSWLIGAVSIESSSAVISGNMINGTGIRLSGDCDSLVIANNIIASGIFCSGRLLDNDVSWKAESFEISCNIIDGRIEVIAGNLSVSGNNIVGPGAIGIEFSVDGEEVVYITDNTVSGCSTGISGSGGEVILVENNLLVNNYNGIAWSGHMIIQNNTIANNTRGISVSSSSGTLRYNNIANNSENSIYLYLLNEDIDATYNWWGTTDTQTINMSIYDYKYNFDLGRVSFVPFLTEPNPEAMPTLGPEIPEFPSWIVLPLLLALTVAVVVFRKKLLR